MQTETCSNVCVCVFDVAFQRVPAAGAYNCLPTAEDAPLSPSSSIAEKADRYTLILFRHVALPRFVMSVISTLPVTYLATRGLV